MNRISIFISAVILAGAAAASEPIIFPAFNDVFMDMGDATIYNTDILKCKYIYGEFGTGSFSFIPYFQFDISGLDIKGDTRCSVILEAAEPPSDESVKLSLSEVSSDWSETSSWEEMIMALPTGLGSTGELKTEDDSVVYIFDVCEILKDAKDKGESVVSFEVIPLGKKDYEARFKSRETGEGPQLKLEKAG